METNTATVETRKIRLNDIVTLANGSAVRIVRIKAGDVWFQDAAIAQIEGVAGWMLGCDIRTFGQFYNLVNGIKG